jgi:ADP-ribosyl-[dinitrogen reductase] hydrolase
MRTDILSNFKTSFDHPLEINALKVPDCRGQLGLTFCPGKKAQSLLDGSHWCRQMELDLDRIDKWGTDCVVTLMGMDELIALEVLDLPGAVASAGMEWQHLPIEDGGIPNSTFEWCWLYTGQRIHYLLGCGKNVLLHCRGGLGRTGLVAARLLIERGMSSAEAMRQVRQARPKTIENSDQENYLHQLSHTRVR